MGERPTHSFDTKGFIFAVKLFVALILIFASWKFLLGSSLTAFILGSENQSEAIAAGKTPDPSSVPEPTGPRFIGERTIQEAVPEEGKFIGANLDTMELFLYEDGELLKEFELYSIGRPGTRWETPSGLYEIQTKEVNHFSSIGEVWMPYSMQFHGNYFIHGWPYYADGTDVPPGFSGGCIRLSTEDTKEVFEFAEVGTPFFVFESFNEESGGGDLSGEAVQEGDNLLERIEAARGVELDNVAPPAVYAASFLVADIDTGQVYAEKNADQVRPIASLSKLLTALVANDTIASERIVTATADAVDTYGNEANLVAGEKMTVSEMLYPLLLYSANDAARSIAGYFGSSFFTTLMNKQARALGMNSSSFVEPSGLSEENVSTANDLFKLARYIHKRKNHIFEITKEESKSITSTLPSGSLRTQTFNNIHQLRHIEGFIGGKNGYISESGQTLLTLFDVTDSTGRERTLAIIVLGSENSTSDSLALLSWIKQAF